MLGALNGAVLRSGADSFLTAAYAILETSGVRPQLTVTCGGHPLPVVATTVGTRTIGAPGTLLGVFDSVEFHPESTTLDCGDVVVFYTNGATDVRPPHSLSAMQFSELVGEAVAPGGSAESIADRIHEALETVLSFNRRDDDIALLVVRVNGDATS